MRAMGGVEALAGYSAGSRLEFLLVPLAYGIGGPVGIVISGSSLISSVGLGRDPRRSPLRQPRQCAAAIA
jgi:hypothetical protein